VNTNTQADRSSYLPLLITGVAVILFSTAAIARMMGWGPNSSDDSGDILVLNQKAAAPTREARARPRCPECGMIMSVREIARHDQDSDPGAAGAVTAGNRDETRVRSAKSYEIIVRMADGSSRVIDDATAASWRIGERLIIIGGVKPSNR
jgi:hypothetical protein